MGSIPTVASNRRGGHAITRQAHAELESRARDVLAGGATHVARSYHPPLFVDRAEGARKWTVDGRELVDYTMGHGALLLGHAHPEVTAAVCRQAGRGTHYGAGHAGEVEWAERVRRLVPSVERVRFTSSGTEATLLALRLARAATGRPMVVTVRDHFHGWHDAVSARATGAVAGIPAATASLTRVVDPDDPEALEAALVPGDVAAVILELSGAHYGATPLPAGYAAQASDLAIRHGALLVADEVVTGFRVDRGGMQALIGITPDLTTLAKILAGGLPGGAVGGRADVMGQLAVPTVSGEPVVRHPGTFNANPLSAAAGCTALRLVEETDAVERAIAGAVQLETICRDRLRAAGVAGSVWRLASVVHCRLDDADANARLDGAMREQGVDLFHGSAFLSIAHGDAELEQTATALDAALLAASTPPR